MASRNVLRLLGYFSTPKEAIKLWVKHNGGPCTQVAINGCVNVDDFSKKVKHELNINNQVALFTSLDKEPIKPWIKITDLLKTDLDKNSGASSLFVKIIPSTEDSIVTKTIFVGRTDDGKPTGKYVQYKIYNNKDLSYTFKGGRGLVHLSDPQRVIVNFKDINDGEKYQLYEFAQDF